MPPAEDTRKTLGPNIARPYFLHGVQRLEQDSRLAGYTTTSMLRPQNLELKLLRLKSECTAVVGYTFVTQRLSNTRSGIVLT